MKTFGLGRVSSRRRFLEHLGGGLLAATVGLPLLKSTFARADEADGIGSGEVDPDIDLSVLKVATQPLDIAVLGAGLAGLCAAYELEKLGHRVTVLEANPNRLGGRVLTRRFSGGIYGELGAMRVPESHRVTRHYISELGLTLREFVQYNPQAYYLVDHRRQRLSEARNMEPHYAYQAMKQGVWGERFDEIVGGMDQLPVQLAARLKSPPRMGCEVTAIEREGTHGNLRPVVVYLEKGQSSRLEADVVLCALPFSVLRKKALLMASFGPRKQSAIKSIDYVTAGKTLAVARRRFWEQDDGIFGGGSFTDLPSGMTWYPSDNMTARDPAVSAAPAVFTASYTIEIEPEDFAGGIAALAPLHPQLSDADLTTERVTWDWDEQPWSRRAFAAEAQQSLIPAAQAADGRVHFAGEHTSYQPAWMQGALSSALRAVQEIHTRTLG